MSSRLKCFIYPGSENDAQPYRDAQLLAHLRAAGCKANDAEDNWESRRRRHRKAPRIRIIEVSEYAALRDLDQRWAGKLVDLLAEGLKV